MTSACNGWAVGYYQNGTAGLALIERWNGKVWKRRRSPQPGYESELSGVAALSARDAWTVGSSNYGRTLIEHWNGRAWKVQRSPNPGGSGREDGFLGVAAVSPRDAWAVGEYNSLKVIFSRTLIAHWNGKAWKVQRSPNPAIKDNGVDGLAAIAAVSSTDAWAVGTDKKRGVYRTLVDHWNGKAWKVQPSPNPSTHFNELEGVAATSSSNAWAVGYYSNGARTGHSRTLIERWNGKAWKVQPSGTGTAGGRFHGVAALSPTEAWAVGHANGGYQTLVEHWNGKSWKLQPTPTPSTTLNELYGVAAVSPKDAWAVGQYAPSSGPADLTLIDHWNGSAWSG